MVQNRKGVKFSALAGDPLPTMCKSVVWNDGVVSVPSAIYQIADNARSKNLHTDLTGVADFSDFVKPRLAIGPKGDHNPEIKVPEQATGIASAQANEPHVPADALYTAVSKEIFPRIYGAGIVAEMFWEPQASASDSHGQRRSNSANSSVDIEVPSAM